MLGIGAGQLQRVVMVSRVGIEPTTHGLKVRCSTAELPAHGAKYTQREGGIASEGTVSNTNRAFRVYELPPSFRFPPLREGNRKKRAYSVPPASRGNLKEGVINCCFL